MSLQVCVQLRLAAWPKVGEFAERRRNLCGVSGHTAHRIYVAFRGNNHKGTGEMLYIQYQSLRRRNCTLPLWANDEGGPRSIEGGRFSRACHPFFMSTIRFFKMGKALNQLRIADGVAARKFYYCRSVYMMAAKYSGRSRSAETSQALVECLRAAEAHKDALYVLWNELLHAAPFLGRQEEMHRTMARYEIVVCDLHAIQTRAFDS